MHASATDQAREKVGVNCKHPDGAEAQEIAGKQWVRSEYCAKHKAELEALGRPGTKTVWHDLEKTRRIVKMYCE
jgi:hypothetical protein